MSYTGPLSRLVGRRVIVEHKPGVLKQGVGRYIRSYADDWYLVVDLDGEAIGRGYLPEDIIGPVPATCGSKVGRGHCFRPFGHAGAHRTPMGRTQETK